MTKLSLEGYQRVISERVALMSADELGAHLVELNTMKAQAEQLKIGRQVEKASQLIAWLEFEMDYRDTPGGVVGAEVDDVSLLVS